MKKEAKFAGADNTTVSVPQYFSWINNTNEGSTEHQTLVNLDFFKWLKDKYGMQINIYAWDAGNFDGASEGYGNLKSEKFISQYPEGYKNVVEKAAEMGIRFGLWGSPDGFGNTKKSQQERFDFYVHLCKDYNFAEFKLDGVCGQLRKSKAKVFSQMLTECRKYSPDLIVLNHRLDLYEAEKQVTTFLWNGEETYTDVFAHNQDTGMHNRVYMFSRGMVRNLERLAEDHGVCISSSLDYFEDDLIYQSFGRCLILAPEMYGNPWFLKDSEYSKLARVYNLHRLNAPILVNGIKLPKSYGCDAVSRGNEKKRFICTGNNKWETQTIKIKLDKEIGLDCKGKIEVIQRNPFDKFVGTYNYGDTIEFDLVPFRATLLEISVKGQSGYIIKNKEYEVIREDENGVALEIRENPKEKPPVYLGSLKKSNCSLKEAELLYESAMFAIDNDSLEYRCIKRSGGTKIPQVQRCRDEFFNQKTYILRGCESRNVFDNNPNTFFDSQSKTYTENGFRINNGCLRVDFGKVCKADCVEIECFSADYATKEVMIQNIPAVSETSIDLLNWLPVQINSVETTDDKYNQEVVKFRVHTTYMLPGKKIKLVYPVNGKIRYFRMANPVDRIFSIKLIKDGKPIKLTNPTCNNLQSSFESKKITAIKSAELLLPDFDNGSYLAVAFEGNHGSEQVYCTAEFDGNLVGFPKRAPDYKANVWEHIVCDEEKNNTFFLPLSDDMKGKSINIYGLFENSRKSSIDVNVYLCAKHK